MSVMTLDLVDATPAREALARELARGWTKAEVAERAGVDQNALYNLWRGQRRTSRRIADGVVAACGELAREVPPRVDGRLPCAVARELVSRGMTRAELARALGVPTAQACHVVDGQRTVQTAIAVRLGELAREAAREEAERGGL